MAYRNYRLCGGLTPEDLESIYREVLLVLAEIGLEIDHSGILEFLSEKPGVTIKGKRVCYDKNLVAEFIPQIKKQNVEYSYNRKENQGFRMIGPYMGQNFVDIDTGERRLATTEDFINAVKLCDSYRMYGPSPLHLQTVPVHLHQVASEKVCVENSREIGGYCVAENVLEAEFMCKIGQTAGRQPPYCTLEIPISPLKLNHLCLALIYQNRDRRYHLSGIGLGGGAVPLVGASAPIFFPGMLVQGMAEALGAYITPKLLDPEVFGYCSFGGFLFDLKKMAPATPFPESVLYGLAVRQVLKYVLGETFGISFSFDPDRPADIFRIAFGSGLGICDGSTSFLGIGSADDGFDPVKAVIQADILKHLKRFSRGINLNEEKNLSRKVIEEAIFTGMPNSFLDHPTTLDYREIYLEPELFFKYSGAELRKKARETARKRISEHQFRLPQDKLEGLEQIYREADFSLRSPQ